MEGEATFDAPNSGPPCKTWYKVVGNLASGPPPLVTLHGGPGGGHEYLGSLDDLWDKYGIPVIFYDQVGCGRSTRFREKMGDVEFWSFDLFCRDLDNLIDHLDLRKRGFSLLGHSWGGVLAATYARRSPDGLHKLIIAGGPASIPLYEKSCADLLSLLPPEARKTLEDCEQKGDYESAVYEKAAAEFYSRHVCRLQQPWPLEVQACFKTLKDDSTAYMTMYVGCGKEIECEPPMSFPL